MAGSFTPIYRNLNDSDTVMNTNYTPGTSTFPTIDALGWSKDGYQFKEYNLSRDGTGTSYHPGENISTSQNIYVIWEEELPSHYIGERTEFEAVADAIRAKGGTTDKLTWPNGFVEEINKLGTGGCPEGAVTLSGGTGVQLYQIYNRDGSITEEPVDEVYGYLPLVSFQADGDNISVVDQYDNYYEVVPADFGFGYSHVTFYVKLEDVSETEFFVIGD